MRVLLVFVVLSGWMVSGLFAGDGDFSASPMDVLLLRELKKADSTMTVGQLRDKCKKAMAQMEEQEKNSPQPEPVVERRMQVDDGNVLKPFTLMAHKANYALFGTYNNNGYRAELYRKQFSDDSIELDNTEAQFQLSVKFPLAVGLFKGTTDIYAAYTNYSLWQVYNEGFSRPFRETNHEPEIWLQVLSGLEIFGFENTVNLFGAVHQSNGQGGVLSRSWNRLYANFIFERGNFVLSLKPWYRIQEKFEEDDNPDITDYLGHYEIGAAYKLGGHTFSVMSRNNLESGFKRGAVELSWSFPLFDYKYIKGYVNYFVGYGESLIDYDNYANRIGIGVCMTDVV